MNNSQGLMWKVLAVAGACVLLALIPLALNRLARKATSETPRPAQTGESAMRTTVRSSIPPGEEAAALAQPTPPIVAKADDLFEDITDQAGIKFVHQYCDNRIANILESNGAGGAILDLDNDGWPDIYLVNAGPLEGVTHHKPGTAREPNRLYRNRGDGMFEDVTQKAGVAGSGYGTAAAAADYDNDGFTDLIVVNVGSCLLYHNRGDGTFENVTVQAGITTKSTGISAVWLDADNDGLLDLFVANYLTFDPNYKLYFNPDAYPGPLSYKPEFNVLYRNLGGGKFEDISEKSGVRVPGHRAMSVCTLDYNHDGFPDIYISNDGTPNSLLVNDGKGHFSDQATKLGVAFNALGEAAGSMAASVGDCNGDGIPDILVSRLGYGSLYMGSPQGLYSDQMMVSRLGGITAQFVGWGCNFFDFDNDTDLDILIANGDAHHLVGWESLLIENEGGGKFLDVREKGGKIFETKIRARGSAVSDFNNDGKMDALITAMGDRAFLLLNRDKSGHHWLKLNLEGTQSNRDGFGAKVTVTIGGVKLYQEERCPAGFLMQSDKRLHFGLGKAAAADKIEIRWPSGQTQELANVKADQVLKIKEPGKAGKGN
ncbi:MAG: CRTAC1 family protein [Verrucomicrobia bacterium]|nr:CRTAC1 family protein [Verrucomicrobiota bacterium]